MSFTGIFDRVGEKVLSKVLPNGVAEAAANDDDCTYESQCGFPYCTGTRLRKYTRYVCAGDKAPHYGPWKSVGCC